MGLIRTARPRRFKRVPIIYVFNINMKNIRIFLSKFFSFLVVKFSIFFNRRVFRNGTEWMRMIRIIAGRTCPKVRCQTFGLICNARAHSVNHDQTPHSVVPEQWCGTRHINGLNTSFTKTFLFIPRKCIKDLRKHKFKVMPYDCKNIISNQYRTNCHYFTL